MPASSPMVRSSPWPNRSLSRQDQSFQGAVSGVFSTSTPAASEMEMPQFMPLRISQRRKSNRGAPLFSPGIYSRPEKRSFAPSNNWGISSSPKYTVQ